VDIAYHYLALDQNGSAIDSNSDGIPDWWEDLWALPVGISDGLHSASADPDGDGLSNLQEYQLGSSPVRPEGLSSGGTYKTLALASTVPPKAYDIYYRPAGTQKWQRISSGSLGQKSFKIINPNPAAEGDYVFLDAADDDGDGLSNGYEDWFSYTPGVGVSSQCTPRSVRLTCPNFTYSTGALLKDGWKVSQGLNVMDNGGVSDPNDPSYVLPGDTFSNQQKHDAYFAALIGSQPGYANYDPLNVTGSANVRPVLTLSQGPASAFNIATFTITRDVGGGGLASPLTVYYAVGGTLQYGADYTLVPAPAISSGLFSTQIPAGQTSVTITAILTSGAVPQGTASLIVTLTPFASIH
jgi:hypothetical protein